jgi:three-Cys-motif partner protein
LPFDERDPANLAALEAELSELKPFPARVNVETSEGDAFERLSAILNELRRDRAQMAPAFLFVDPYGFKIPAGLLGDLMKAGRAALFINVLWRELDMLVQQRNDRLASGAHGQPCGRSRARSKGRQQRQSGALARLALRKSHVRRFSTRWHGSRRAFSVADGSR